MSQPASAVAVPPTAAAPLGVSFAAVSKRYGALHALRSVTLSIAPGEFVALLGPNGSGKSTLIKVAATLARPTQGTIHFTSCDEQRIEAGADARARIGLVAHSTLVYDELTAEENLTFFARLYGVDAAASRVRELLASVGLAARSGSLVRTFSRGMRQRLSIARALLPSPGLLLLDEPTTGLDREAMQWLTACLRDLHRSGCTIVMSTHGASAVLDLATRTIELDAGAVKSDTAAQSSGGAA